MLLISAISLAKLSAGHFKLKQIFEDLLTLMIGQSPSDEFYKLKWNFKFKNSLNKFSFVLLIVIWSQSASILTKAFTGLLLNTYFNQKFIPIVETIQDIYSNKEISIAADSEIFKGYSRRIDVSNEMKTDILSRIIEFERKLMQSEKVREFEMRWKRKKLL